MTPREAFFHFLLPAAFGLIASYASAREQDVHARVRPWMFVVLLAIGLAFGLRSIIGAWPAVRPVSAEGWLFHLGAAGTVAAAILNRRTRTIATLAGAAMFVAFGLRKGVVGAGSESAMVAAAVGAFAIVASPALGADGLAKRLPPMRSAIVFAAGAVFSAPALFFSATLKFAMVAAMITALGAGVIVGTAAARRSALRPLMTAAALILGGAWAIARLYAEAPWPVVVLGAGALAAGWGAASAFPRKGFVPALITTGGCGLASVIVAAAMKPTGM